MNREELKKLYDYLSKVSGINTDDFEQLLDICKVETINKNDYFLPPGHNSNKFGFTLEGVLKSYFLTDNGNTFIKSFITPFDLCASFKNPHADYSAEVIIQAITDCKHLTFSFTDLAKLTEKSRRIEKLQRNILEVEFCKNEKKEYLFTTMKLVENYYHIKSELGVNFCNVKQKDIANYLGITEVALSRIKKRIESV